jgi:hypothetical protein
MRRPSLAMLMQPSGKSAPMISPPQGNHYAARTARNDDPA